MEMGITTSYMLQNVFKGMSSAQFFPGQLVGPYFQEWLQALDPKWMGTPALSPDSGT